jgi:beta-mannosidase
MARARSVDWSVQESLGTWELVSVAPGSFETPAEIEGAGVHWQPAIVPGTAAGALRAIGAWSFDAARDFDADDWWYRCTMAVGEGGPGGETLLRFAGLATLADVWLDGEFLLHSEDMFVEHAVPVGEKLRDGSRLFIRFHSLAAALKARRPRPRWRAQIVAQQQLRWHRTTLLGRIPAWSPPVAAVGPWRPVTLERRARVGVDSADVRPRMEGRDGVVEAVVRLHAASGAGIDGATLVVGAERTRMEIATDADVVVARGVARVRDAELWWPHTHGAQPLYEVRLIVHGAGGEASIDLGRTGFRDLTVDRADGGFAVRVNGQSVFCRGACWTPLDVVGLGTDIAACRTALLSARAAGMNMIRVGGTMVYESDDFFALADELGIMIWHDFMFSNMDYPIADAAFADAVRVEATQFLDRVQLAPSLVVLCGGSEVEQQAAMLGLPRAEWTSPLFAEILPSIARALRPDVEYVPSSPMGGDLPFQVDEGVSHYYGVGAYGRPLEDARRAHVRFASECLAFANIPGDETIEQLMRDGECPPQHPRWKGRVPRDKSTGWDFDDVRDGYLRDLFGEDPSPLRYTDVARYLALGRVTSGLVMAAAMSEWRRRGSACRGALVWFLRDLWPGAGWGVVDSDGRPKAAYHFLKRTLQPVALLAIDEGLNGLVLHALNETARAIDAELRLTLFRDGEVRIAEGVAPVRVPARDAIEVRAAALFGRFVDTTYAYRFGPPAHDVALAVLVDRATGATLAEAVNFPGRPTIQRSPHLGLEAVADRIAVDEWRVVARSRAFAFGVAVEARGWDADDDFFHIAPGGERAFTLRARKSGSTLPSVSLLPLNAVSSTKVAIRTNP